MNLSRLTIRARITGGSLLIAVLISIVAGIVIYSQVARIVGEGQTRVLEGITGPYITAIDTGDTAEFDLPGPGQFVAVVDPSGAVTLNTLPSPLAGKVEELAAKPDGQRSVETPSRDFVVRTTSVVAPSGTWHVVAASDNDSAVLNDVAFLLISSIAGINLAFGAASWLIGSAALSPVSRLRRSAAELVTTPGTALLPVGPARDEISELAGTLNELIRELRASADRERQIVADASHEFRTPLAIIQTRLELAQRQATTLDEMKVDVAAAQKTLSRLASLSSSLLELSRIDAQRESGRATADQLAVELTDAVDRSRTRVADRDIRIDFTESVSARAAIVGVSEADFGRICDNLLNNAVAALGAVGSVELRLSDEDAGGLKLSVIDTGGGMDESFLPFALDRFSRQSEARTRGGAGLGLSIVAGIAANAGGSVTLTNSPGVGLRVDVLFPYAHVAGPRSG